MDSTRPIITDQNLGPVVNIATWLLLVISVVAVVARLSTKWAVTHRMNWDDLLIGISLIFLVGNGVATSFEATNGLGSPSDSSSSEQLLKAQKFAFWTVFFIIEILLNTALMVIPVIIMWGLRVRRMQKVALACCFGFRIFVVGALIAQAFYYSKASKSSDFIFHAWKPTIAGEVVLCLAYVAPCVPYLRPFLESLDSGMLRNEPIRRMGHSTGGSQGYGSSLGLDRVSNRNSPRNKYFGGDDGISSPEIGTDTGLGSRNEKWYQFKKGTPSLDSHASNSQIIKTTTSITWEHEPEMV
ncbi:hypothetical protein G7Y89_g11197 [Cudoniella acicularis]|uniref:Rhodopsin domain-containing protein n=1 Tax=Cudoniella acicularis TaxID=354080 RepID=A0A8H4RBB5_9HELO|nr:hypothetical protein G7Y89_g11197 [Cudoniella acicularis]